MSHQYVKKRKREDTDTEWTASDLVSLGKSGGGQVNGLVYNAFECFLVALEIDPQYAPAWYELGKSIEPDVTVLVNRRKYDAYGCFRKALDADPQHAKSWYAMYVQLEERGAERFRFFIDGTPYDMKDCLIRSLDLGIEDYSPWYVLGKKYLGGVVNGQRYHIKDCLVKSLEYCIESVPAIWDELYNQCEAEYNMNYYWYVYAIISEKAYHIDNVKFSSDQQRLGGDAFMVQFTRRHLEDVVHVAKRLIMKVGGQNLVFELLKFLCLKPDEWVKDVDDGNFDMGYVVEGSYMENLGVKVLGDLDVAYIVYSVLTPIIPPNFPIHRTHHYLSYYLAQGPYSDMTLNDSIPVLHILLCRSLYAMNLNTVEGGDKTEEDRLDLILNAQLCPDFMSEETIKVIIEKVISTEYSDNPASLLKRILLKYHLTYDIYSYVIDRL